MVSQVWSGLNYLGDHDRARRKALGDRIVPGAVARASMTRRPRIVTPIRTAIPGAGALWVACYNLDEIERVSTTGIVTRFPVPSHLSNYPDVLSAIVKGPGGMWLTEYAGNRIGRISVR